MREAQRMLASAALPLTVVCTGLLIYNMVGLHFHKDAVFFSRGAIDTFGELVVLIGFAAVLLFDVASVAWVFYRMRRVKVAEKRDRILLALGVLCLVLLGGEKAMIDEISREYLLGWEVLGEWIVLYVFLMIQMVFNILILDRVYRQRNA